MKIYTYTHTQGVSSRGIKKPLVNPATLDMIGDRRNAYEGKAEIINMRRDIQVWLRAIATTTSWRKTVALQYVIFTSCKYNKQ